jgi:DNA-binding transcriptional regulator WhiA
LAENEIVLTGLLNTQKFSINDLLAIEKMSFQKSFIILRFKSGRVTLLNDFENIFDFLSAIKDIKPTVSVEI